MDASTVVIGAGRVGRTVAARLPGARLYGRGQQPDLDDCRRLLIATPDAAIEQVCEALAPRLDADGAVIHFSGATSVHALDARPRPDRLRAPAADDLARAAGPTSSRAPTPPSPATRAVGDAARRASWA